MKYTVIKSKRKTICLEVIRSGEIILRLPMKADENSRHVQDFIKKHEQRMISKSHEILALNKNAPEISPKHIEELKQKAKNELPQRIEHFSEIMGLYPTGVKITSALRRFGSCSGKNSLCFSYTLMQYPQKAIDYVIIHELAHIRHKNHGREFYALIEKYMPDYKEAVKMLKN